MQTAIANTAGASGFGGSVVAIEPSTGAVKVMASVPGYDPNDVAEDPAMFKQLNKDDELAAVQPPDPGHLPAGLDDEGGDRGRGARLG